MKKMVQVKAENVGQWVLDNLREKGKIEFALNAPENSHTQEYGNWWFMTWIEFPEYDSMSLYIDYCGGGYGRAIPYYDDEDFCEQVECYFNRHMDYTKEEGVNFEINQID